MARTRTQRNTRKAQGKTRKTSAPRPRVDWSKRAAPKVGSKQRAAYERSAVFKRRQAAAQKGIERRALREEARQRLARFVQVVDAKADGPVIERARAQWHDAKADLEESEEDYDRFLAILDSLAEEEAPDWQIAYSSDESAA